jgi:hypothetical protein
MPTEKNAPTLESSLKPSATSIGNKTSGVGLSQVLTSHEGKHISDELREEVFASLVPEPPDLGGGRVDRGLREVIGEMVEHKIDKQGGDRVADVQGIVVPEPVIQGTIVSQGDPGSRLVDTNNEEPVAVNTISLPPPRIIRRNNGGSSGGSGMGNRDEGGGRSGGGGGRDREGPPNPEDEWVPESPERGRAYVEQVLNMRTTMAYDVIYGREENKSRIRRLYDGIGDFVNELVVHRHSQKAIGPHMRFPRPAADLTSEELLHPVVEFAPHDEEMERMRDHAQAFLDRYQLGDDGNAEEGQSQFFEVAPLPDPAEQRSSLTATTGRYNEATNLQTNTREWRAAHPNWRQELREDQEVLQNFFKHAKNQGLLREVDSILNSAYEQIAGSGAPPDQINRYLSEVINTAIKAGENVFVEKMIADQSLEQLEGVWEPYLNWAIRRMEIGIRGQTLPEPREGEWVFTAPGQERDGARRETYWGLGPYPKMYVITAQTEEQFTIAKESFLQMIRSGMLGRAPTANFEHVKNFIDEFSRSGGDRALKKKISKEFLEENRLELEALLYLLVGNYSKEVYNPQQAKDAAMAMAGDEGPQRWVRAFRAGKGKVAGFTHMFDYEEMMDIFNNSVGQQGELAIIAGHFLQDTIQEIAIERGMGMVLKDYDPRDENLRSGGLGAKIQAAVDLDRIRGNLKEMEVALANGNLVLPDDVRRTMQKAKVITVKRDGRIELRKGATVDMLLSDRDRARYNAYKTNLNRLGLTRSVEEFKSLYEGFDKGDYHINNYLAYKEDERLWDEDQQRPEDERSYRRKYPEFSTLPASIRQSIELGEVQVLLKDARQAILKGEIKLGPGETAKDLLSPRQREIYQEAYDEAETSFEIAFQMQNVMGEKARRGKGFVYVDRNEHIQTYFAVSDAVRCRWADGTKTTVINIDGLSTQEIDVLIPKLVINGDLRNEDIESFKKGWMIYKVSRDNKKPENFSEEWKRLYEGMSDKERDDVVDNIPTYKAENWVQWGVTQIKMKYADSPVELRRQKVKEGWRRLTKEIKTKGYSAQLWDDELENDQPKLMRYKRPLGRIDPATGEFKKFKNGEVLGYGADRQPVRLRFGDDGKPDGLPFTDGKLVVFDSADLEARQQITIEGITPDTIARRVDQASFEKEMDLIAAEVVNGKSGSVEEFKKLRHAITAEVGDTLIEEAVPTFDFAASGADFRSNYTQDSYNYYQGNDRVSAFLPHVLLGKYAIAVGLSRPEDEDILARRGMVTDPTRRRTRKLPDVQQEREVSLVASAVLESLQDRMRIRHGIYRAFLPKDANVARMRMGYRNEDWAGMDRFTFGFVELAAQQPQRFSRRFGAEIAISPLEHDSGPARWGEHGVSGGVKLLADEIGNISHQKLKGQFGLTKLFESHDKAIELYNHLAGYTDPNKRIHVYGLYRKPTDNNEKMHKYLRSAQTQNILGHPEHSIPFLYDFKECFGRLQTVVQDMEFMYSSIDNAQGGVNIEDHEVFLPSDGSFNTAIEDPKVLANNGVGRNRQTAFLDGEDGEQGFYRWLVDDDPGGGAHIYRKEGYWNMYLFNHYADTKSVKKPRSLKGRVVEQWMLGVDEDGGIVKDWLTEKMR